MVGLGWSGVEERRGRCCDDVGGEGRRGGREGEETGGGQVQEGVGKRAGVSSHRQNLTFFER